MKKILDDKSSSAALSPVDLTEEIRKAALRRLFKTPAFNHQDGLDDYDSDFRSYARIGDMVTADMRHRLEQTIQGRKKRAPDHSPGTTEDHPPRSPAHRPTPETGPPTPRVVAPHGGEKLNKRMFDDQPGMKGSFAKKPSLFLDPGRCGHRQRGITGCRLCVDRCPSRAIRETKNGLQIDQRICSGCGICSLVCPSGAVSFIHPDPRQALEQVRPCLSKGLRPALVFFESGEKGKDGTYFPVLAGTSQSPVIAVGVPVIAAAGMDIWFAALACGAGEIILCPSHLTPAAATAELTAQIRTAGDLLEGVGLSPTRVRMVDPGPPWEFVRFGGATRDDGWDEKAVEPATFGFFQDKRQLISTSLQFLHERTGGMQGAVQLPENAAFGEVRISKEACTLCMACAAVCPTAALRPGTDHPRLSFCENACTQCGLCAAACPEEALSLHPRMVMPPAVAHARRIMHEEAPFCCIRCGRPFAAKATLDRIAEKLHGHWMFQKNNELKRLQMCRDCRVTELIQAGRSTARAVENEGKE